MWPFSLAKLEQLMQSLSTLQINDQFPRETVLGLW
jgi:hypothetical protein